ncbi:alkaline shock response membrane anchor protein AmaP [Actinomadura logoneensis]|uniref:Alkaline shock response membrane anchor protein AmaP n=1 Tax=Actinomadura logoneensis TaxID=2293572 RepID=A0A372JK11_9ACTN|nr:alkaline shock response membrane anchor protein AmaP [Actinomadura logoneensis]RFU40363.1 alkaline shock response membrane anchor protein AmaP [Actinomadura logoneensis]
MDRHAARLNRVLLVLTGLLLAAAGGAGLALGLRAFGSARAHQPVLSGQTRHFATAHGWYWPVVAALAVLLAIIGIAWLLAQGRSDRIGGVVLDEDEHTGRTIVPAGTVATALQDDIERVPGVHAARVRLSGKPSAPAVRVNVAYDRRADLLELRDRIRDSAFARLRHTLELERVPAVVRLRLVTGDERRTVE